MQSLAKSLGTAIFGALLAGAPLLAQGINIDYDHTTDFKQFKSYHWEKIHATDPLVEQRINLAVDRDLGNISLHEVDKDSKADLILTAVESSKSQREYVEFYHSIAGFVWRPSWVSGGFADSIPKISQIPLGTLVIDMYDGKTHKLLWRGTAGDATSVSTNKNDLNMDKAIDTMLDKFPPKAEK